MKKTLALLVSLAFVAGLASAAPSLYGSNGLIMTISPDNAGPMNFGIGVHGLLSMKSEDFTGYSTSWRNIDVVPEGYFSINEMLEFSVASGYRLFNYTYTPTTGTEVSTDKNGALDTRIGFKGSFIRGEGFNLGAYLGYTYRSGKKYNPFYSWVDDAWKKDSLYSATGAITFLAIPGFKADKFRTHLNIGVDYNLDKYNDKSINPSMVVPFGVGFCYDVGMVDLMLDIAGTVMESDSSGTKYYKSDGTEYTPSLMNYPMWIAPGLRLKFAGMFNFDLGFAYNLQTKDSTLLSHDRSDYEEWFAIVGLAYAPFKAAGPKVPATGIIAGKITDKAGKGLAAVVTAGGLTANTDPATGAYQIAGIEIGAIPTEVKADAKGYVAKSSSVMLMKKHRKTPAGQDFVLELKPIPASDVSGVIVSYKEKKPISNAVLTFKGPKTVSARTDAIGKFNTKLEEGNYQVTAEAEGYKPYTFNLAAKGGLPVVQNASLVKIGEKFVFNNIYFAVGKSHLAANADIALEQLYTILKEHPYLRVEISGHTSSPGSNAANLKLSQARAEAVVTWLVAKGVKADQLVAKGYGEDKPIATNKTKAGREQNRRIEVTVID
jgi:outer membrane protein OmpA-like peptidoglycan-associated protein